MSRLSYTEFEQRYNDFNLLLDVVFVLRDRNRNAEEMTYDEKQKLIFLETSAERYLNAVNRKQRINNERRLKNV